MIVDFTGDRITVTGTRAELERAYERLTGKAADVTNILTVADLAMMDEGAEVIAGLFSDEANARGERCTYFRLGSGRWMPIHENLSVDGSPGVSSYWLATNRRPKRAPGAHRDHRG